VSCTASSLPIVGLGMVERALKKRRHRPLFMVDLAVPRDIEAEVAQLSDAFIYTVDDLAELVKEGVQARQHAVGHAEAIIDHGVQSYLQWKSVRAQVPLIKSLTAHAEKLQSLELQHAQRLLARGEPVEDVLKALAHSMSQKLLHGAYARLSSPDAQTRDRAAEVLPELFGFDVQTPPNRPH